MINFDAEVDAIGLKCPMPILKCKKGLNQLERKGVLKIMTTDKDAKKDFDFFCKQTGHKILSIEDHESVTTFFIEKS